MVYEPAFAVNLKAICKCLRASLSSKGVSFVTDRIQKLEQKENTWNIIGGKGDRAADKVALALGSRTDAFFPAFGQIEGGDLAIFSETWPMDTIWAHNGLHAAPSHQGKGIAIGSTRWNKDKKPSRTAAENELRERATALEVNVSQSHILKHWRGIRSVWPSDRLPKCGRIPNLNNLYALLGLGGKGLLWGPFAAKVLAQNIVNNDPIPMDLSTNKVKPTSWRSPHLITSC